MDALFAIDAISRLEKLLNAENLTVCLHKNIENDISADIKDGYIKDGIMLKAAVGFGCDTPHAIDDLIERISGKTLVINPCSETYRREMIILI